MREDKGAKEGPGSGSFEAFCGRHGIDRDPLEGLRCTAEQRAQAEWYLGELEAAYERAGDTPAWEEHIKDGAWDGRCPGGEDAPGAYSAELNTSAARQGGMLARVSRLRREGKLTEEAWADICGIRPERRPPPETDTREGRGKDWRRFCAEYGVVTDPQRVLSLAPDGEEWPEYLNDARLRILMRHTLRLREAYESAGETDAWADAIDEFGFWKGWDPRTGEPRGELGNTSADTYRDFYVLQLWRAGLVGDERLCEPWGEAR